MSRKRPRAEGRGEGDDQEDRQKAYELWKRERSQGLLAGMLSSEREVVEAEFIDDDHDEDGHESTSEDEKSRVVQLDDFFSSLQPVSAVAPVSETESSESSESEEGSETCSDIESHSDHLGPPIAAPTEPSTAENGSIEYTVAEATLLAGETSSSALIGTLDGKQPAEDPFARSRRLIAASMGDGPAGDSSQSSDESGSSSEDEDSGDKLQEIRHFLVDVKRDFAAGG